MLINEEIKQNEIIKVLVNNEEEDFDEEVYAIVQDNRGDHLEVKYYEETDKEYKFATIYELNDNIEVITFESISEHYPDTYELSDLDMKKVGDNMYVYMDDIDLDEDSEIRTIQDDDEYSLDSFVVADDDVEDDIVERPRDYKKIEQEWNEWNPKSPGARSFKDTVDMIEYHAKLRQDEKNAFN